MSYRTFAASHAVRMLIVACAPIALALVPSARADAQALPPVIAGTAAGQQAQNPDSIAPRRAVTVLTTVSVVAEARRSRNSAADLRAGNRELEAFLREQGVEIARLERHLDSLKTIAAEREKEIAALDSATAESRRKRLELEARLRALESGGGAA